MAKKLAIPLHEKVGPELTFPEGVVNYVVGLATPLQLLKQGVRSWLDLETTGTLNYTQAAGAAAVTGNALFPWGMIESAVLQIGGNGAFDQTLGGHGMYVRQLHSHPAFTPTFSAPLPGANAGTQPATGTEAWDWRQRLSISFSERDLHGLLFMESQSATAYLNLRFRAASDVLNLSAGSTATFSGQVNVTGYGFGLGSLDKTDLSIAHIQEEIPAALTSGATYQQIPLHVGDIVQRIFLMSYVNGLPDTTNQVQLSEVELQIGASRPQVWTAQELQYSNQVRDRSNLPNGVWVIDWTNGGGTQYKDWRRQPQAWLNLRFTSGVPAGSQIMLIYELQRLFGALA